MASEYLPLRCNYVSCEQRLTGDAFVTSCSHMFCEDHAKKMLSMPAEKRRCLVCKSALSQSLDIMLNKLSPSSEFKSMVLAGFNPDEIFDIADRGLKFYIRQTLYEGTRNHYLSKKKQEAQFKEKTHSFEEIILKQKEEIARLKKKLKSSTSRDQEQDDFANYIQKDAPVF